MLGIMIDTAADHAFGGKPVLAGHQVRAKRQVRRDLFAHHPLRLTHRIRPAKRQTAQARGNHHVGFRREREGIHGNVKPAGIFRLRHDGSTFVGDERAA